MTESSSIGEFVQFNDLAIKEYCRQQFEVETSSDRPTEPHFTYAFSQLADLGLR